VDDDSHAKSLVDDPRFLASLTELDRGLDLDADDDPPVSGHRTSRLRATPGPTSSRPTPLASESDVFPEPIADSAPQQPSANADLPPPLAAAPGQRRPLLDLFPPSPVAHDRGSGPTIDGGVRPTIVRAAALLAAPRATELLVRIVRRNAPAHLSACGDLLLRCVVAPMGATGDLEQIAAALIDALPGDPTRREEVGTWTRPTPVTPGFVVDLLTATSRIDAGLAARGIEHLLAWPKTYEPDDVLIPAARAFAKQVESTAWPAVGRLREASLDHLRRRIALPLQAPRDWTRTNLLKCTCGDCRGLGAFLVAPDQQQWRLKAVQDRRTHVEQSVQRAACDLDVMTERRGSPHTLVATKNQASYERRSKQRRQDLEHVSALGG